MQQWQQQLQQLEAWWQTPAGRSLLDIEIAYLSKRLQTLFGYRLLLVATEAFAELSNVTRISQVTRVDPLSDDLAQLAGTSNDLDVVIVPHLFAYLPKFSEYLLSINHQLQDHGKLIITGFHYRSWLGWQKFWRQKSVRGVPKTKHAMGVIKKVLLENNFIITRAEHFAGGKLSKKMSTHESQLQAQGLGNLTCFICQKQLASVKNMKAAWQASTQAKTVPAQTYIGEHHDS